MVRLRHFAPSMRFGFTGPSWVGANWPIFKKVINGACATVELPLYIAVHSGRGFFDLGKGRENPAQLCQRFTSELKWFTEMMDIFCCR